MTPLPTAGNHELILPGSTMPRCKHCNHTWMHLEQVLTQQSKRLADPAEHPCPQAPKAKTNV